MDCLSENWPIVLVAALVVVALLFLLLRPRQRVQLSQDSAPRAPAHGGAAKQRRRGVPPKSRRRPATSAARSSMRGSRHLPGASGPPDDLQRLKGVGPKFASMLNERGIIRFEQLAAPVRRRDRADRPDRSARSGAGCSGTGSSLQASYLARGDTDGFEQSVRKALGFGLAPSAASAGGVAISLSILRPSMSTISNRQPW